jgi:hypothetical protein
MNMPFTVANASRLTTTFSPRPGVRRRVRMASAAATMATAMSQLAA